jgi:hypothetical protein
LADLPADRLAALAHSWLYFGIMAELLQKPIDLREFEKRNEDANSAQGTKLVTAAPLRELLDEWLRFRVAPVLNPAFIDTFATNDAEMTKDQLTAVFQKRYRLL